MAEAEPAAPYDARLKRALDALVYAPPSGASNAAAANDEVLRADDADTTQARCNARPQLRWAGASRALLLRPCAAPCAGRE